MQVATAIEVGTKCYYDSDTIEYYWVSLRADSNAPTEHTIKVYVGVLAWMVDTFGPALDWSIPDRRWAASNGRYYFKNEADRTLFMLRWG